MFQARNIGCSIHDTTERATPSACQVILEMKLEFTGLLLLTATGLLLAGCVDSSGQPQDQGAAQQGDLVYSGPVDQPANGQPQGNFNRTGFRNGSRGGFGGRGNFTGNLTPEQQAAFAAQRAAAMAACQGKQENDSCEFTAMQGNVTTGTCQSFNGANLSCRPQRNGFGMPPNGNPPTG